MGADQPSPTYSVVRAFAYGRGGRRHAIVLSSHTTVEDAFRALDALATADARAPVDCYVVDEDRNPVRRP